MKSWVLKLDYDKDNWFQLFNRRLEIAQRILDLELVNVSYRESKTKGHYHVRVEVLSDLLTEDRVLALELCLGSDPVRGLYAIRRLSKGRKNWDILARDKEVCKEIYSSIDA